MNFNKILKNLAITSAAAAAGYYLYKNYVDEDQKLELKKKFEETQQALEDSISDFKNMVENYRDSIDMLDEENELDTDDRVEVIEKKELESQPSNHDEEKLEEKTIQVADYNSELEENLLDLEELAEEDSIDHEENLEHPQFASNEDETVDMNNLLNSDGLIDFDKLAVVSDLSGSTADVDLEVEDTNNDSEEVTSEIKDLSFTSPTVPSETEDLEDEELDLDDNIQDLEAESIDSFQALKDETAEDLAEDVSDGADEVLEFSDELEASQLTNEDNEGIDLAKENLASDTNSVIDESLQDVASIDDLEAVDYNEEISKILNFTEFDFNEEAEEVADVEDEEVEDIKDIEDEELVSLDDIETNSTIEDVKAAEEIDEEVEDIANIPDFDINKDLDLRALDIDEDSGKSERNIDVDDVFESLEDEDAIDVNISETENIVNSYLQEYLNSEKAENEKNHVEEDEDDFDDEVEDDGEDIVITEVEDEDREFMDPADIYAEMHKDDSEDDQDKKDLEFNINEVDDSDIDDLENANLSMDEYVASVKKLYPYVSEGLIRSARSKKDNIDKNYHDCKSIMLFHSNKFVSFEAVSNFANRVEDIGYGANIDYGHKIVEVTRVIDYKNTAILADIYRVANEAGKYNGSYETFAIEQVN